METTTIATQAETKAAAQLADSLRRIAAFIEANPALAEDLRYSLDEIRVPHIRSNGNAREYLATYARAAAKAGAKVTKNFGEKWSNVELAFGATTLLVYADRADVCERVVVGTEEVTEEVPDSAYLADAPLVKVTKTVEKVEWRCSPILAEAGGAA